MLNVEPATYFHGVVRPQISSKPHPLTPQNKQSNHRTFATSYVRLCSVDLAYDLRVCTYALLLHTRRIVTFDAPLSPTPLFHAKRDRRKYDSTTRKYQHVMDTKAAHE